MSVLMQFLRAVRFSALLAAGVVSSVGYTPAYAGVGENSFEVLYQGIAHDAWYGICMKGDSGLVVGVEGSVLNTSDFGQSWQLEVPVTEQALLGVSCSGQSTIVVGQSGHIQRRVDGGDWELVSSGTELRILSVDANQQGLAVAVGGFGIVLLSQDAGSTWAQIEFDWEVILNDFLEPHIYDVEVFEDGSILIVGEFELVMVSTNRGDTWEVTNKADSSLFSVHFNNRQSGFAVGQNGRLLKTNDGGLTWQAKSLLTQENLLDVWSSEKNDVVVTGIRTLLRSHDEGESWQTITVGDISRKWYQAVAGIELDSDGSQSNIIVGHAGRIVQIN